MRQELDQWLCQRYPKIFADRHRPMRETCMCWGFSCGDGWFGILDALCENLQTRTDRHGDPQARAVQVKEKFGGLRFYAGGTSPIQFWMIQLAESLSYRVCEQCGAPGQPWVAHHWHSTRCRAHAPPGGVLVTSEGD